MTTTSEENVKAPGEKNIFGPTRREEERRLQELQKKQRQESLDLLGFDALESHCPHCKEKYSLMISDAGREVPEKIMPLVFFIFRLRRTEVTLHCVSCGKEYKTPSLLKELCVPLLIVATVALVVLADCVLLSYLCRY